MAAAVHSRTTGQCVINQVTRSILALPLHSDFGLEILAIASDAGDGELLVAGHVLHDAIALGRITFDDCTIPTLGVAHVVDLDVVVHAPEERDGIEALARAENVAGRCLALALRDDPMLDADRAAAVGIRPARDVPRRENVRRARLETFVDDDALVLFETKGIRELRPGPNAD